ncbi:MAG: hypothetical protein K8R90_05965 [Candidatus Cloacimonetes bacterium]|nr:hypothetical protein [Candidatus Cloacimonadota bacterium]
MNIGILTLQHGELNFWGERMRKILVHNDIAPILISPSDPGLIDKIKGFDFLINTWGHYSFDHQMIKTILPVVEEHLNIPCFPDRATWWSYDDKLRQKYLCDAHGYPMVPSWVFWERSDALEWLKTTDYPVVFKLKGGAGSSNVVLVKTRQQGEKLVRQMFGPGLMSGKFHWSDQSLRHRTTQFIRRMQKKAAGHESNRFWMRDKNYIMFQKFMPGNEFDMRITTIGDRAFGFLRYNRPNDFRASGSGKIEYNCEKIDRNCLEIALRISREQRFQTMTYDFLYDASGQPFFCEISYTYQDLAVFKCAGFWDSDMNYHEGHFWPEYLHLVDFLKMPELEQPDFSEEFA